MSVPVKPNLGDLFKEYAFKILLSRFDTWKKLEIEYDINLEKANDAYKDLNIRRNGKYKGKIKSISKVNKLYNDKMDSLDARIQSIAALVNQEVPSIIGDDSDDSVVEKREFEMEKKFENLFNQLADK